MPEDRQDRAEPITIAAGSAAAIVDHVAGGRVAQITVAGQPLLIEPDAARSPTVAWGSFPMAPWAGRIRRGRFEFGGRVHQLERNHLDGPRDAAGAEPGDREGSDHDDRWHAIHGTVFVRPWEIEQVTATAVSLRCPLADHGGWPFPGGTARQRIEISGDRLECVLSLEASEAPFPAVIGWHPWFLRPARLHFEPRAMYERDHHGLPTGAIVPPTEGPWDDCFVATGPAIVEYDRDDAPRVTVSSDCDHWVVFDEPETSICVEPQSGPPDGLRLGHQMVAPGRPLERTMRISW